jgi:hypothetical protein
MLVHLRTTYGDITPLEIEMNRATLSAPWNPDDEIEDLWKRIITAQQLAHLAEEEITDPIAIRLTIDALEASGVFDFALDNWRLKDNATKLWPPSRSISTRKTPNANASSPPKLVVIMEPTVPTAIAPAIRLP